MEARIDRKIYLVDSKVDSVGLQVSTVDSKVVSAHVVTDSKVDSVGTQVSTVDSKSDSVGVQVSTVDSKVISAHSKTDSKIDSLGEIVAGGIQSVAAGATGSVAASSYAMLTLDAGTDGADILGIAIKGVVGSNWDLGIYVPTADGVTTANAEDKRNRIVYKDTDEEGGLLSPFAFPYNAMLKFQNLTGGDAQLDEVIVTYRSPGTLSATWSIGA